MSGAELKIGTEIEFDPEIPAYLPRTKTYSIQVGSKQFYLSGASLSSDAPSYFTNYFGQEENSENVLFIDRDPATFGKIYSHLQGYVLNIEDDYEFIRLWADSCYFGLRRLQDLLTKDEIFVSVGHKSFRIPKQLLLNVGNNPNFFTIASSTLYVDNSSYFRSKKLMRPPPERPISVPHRSGELFSDLMELLRGNSTVIANSEHRALLLKECRYYRFMELEQRIINYKIIQNPFALTGQEIVVNLIDLQYAGVKYDTNSRETQHVLYSRPYIINEPHRSLIIEISSDQYPNSPEIYNSRVSVDDEARFCQLCLGEKLGRKFRQVFKQFERATVSSDVETEKNSIFLLALIDGAKTSINGMEVKKNWLIDLTGTYKNLRGSVDDGDEPHIKRQKLTQNRSKILIEFQIVRSLWRMKVTNDIVQMEAVKLDLYTDNAKFTDSNVDFL